MIMMPFPHIIGLVLLLLLVPRGSSVSVTTSPSNDTVNGTFLLANSQHPYPTQITLAPLTADLAALDLGDFRVSFSSLFVKRTLLSPVTPNTLTP
jgi:hypothetical protein